MAEYNTSKTGTCIPGIPQAVKAWQNSSCLLPGGVEATSLQARSTMVNIAVNPYTLYHWFVAWVQSAQVLHFILTLLRIFGERELWHLSKIICLLRWLCLLPRPEPNNKHVATSSTSLNPFQNELRLTQHSRLVVPCLGSMKPTVAHRFGRTHAQQATERENR